MLPFVWPFWDNGETLQPCRDCPNWQVQLFRLPTSGAVMVREWHDAACAFWERVIAQSNDGVEQLP
jgi:hypothetical protein